MGVSDVSRTFVPPSPSADTELDYSAQLALLAAIVESSDDAIVSKTLEGRILSWNAGAQRIFGYRADEVIGKPITLIIPPELHDEEQRILAQVGQGQRIDHFDTTRVTKDGRRISISLTVSPVRDSRGTIVAASKVARDISERKRAEQALRESEEALREADRRKDEFLALLAHELRNPLAPIRYALATARQPGTTPEQRERADEIMDRQLTLMSRLLDDLLDISRITHGTLELKKEPMELAAAISTGVETARPFLEAKRHTLLVEVPQSGLGLEADAGRLAQVFSNLLINAAKYTDPGGHIQLRAARLGDEVAVTVSDNGIGIPEDMLPCIFALFSQVPAARERAQGGLGIGLSLVRGLVSLHGGRVEARSQGVGRGSEFIVHLPAATPLVSLVAELSRQKLALTPT
jgi:PAS domain S-box-containing protein